MRRSLAVALTAAGICLGLIAGRAGSEQEKKAYLVVQADITDAAQYVEYAKLSPATVAKFGGRYLARAGRTITLEGPPAKSRVVVIEFPSLEGARAWYDSPEYVAARTMRAGAAEAQFVVVEGVE